MQVTNKRLTRFSEIKLDSLLEVTKAINSNQSVDEILDIFKSILETKLNISKMILYSHYKNGWMCMLASGVNDDYSLIDVEQDLLHIKDIVATRFSKDTPIEFLDNESCELLDIVIPVFHKTQPLAYLLIGDEDDSTAIIRPSIKHLDFVQTLTSIISVAIENKRLFKANIHQAGAKKELELASIMQNMLFPENLPSNEKIDAAAFYLPHQEVGGDYYDYVKISDNEIAFCVADVSGKGVAAALLMSNFQATLRMLAKYISSLPELVQELNRIVMQNAKGEKFITFFIAKYEIDTRKLTYVNAAHNPPVMITNDETVVLESGCVGLGMLEEIPVIEQGELVLPKGASVICYTDGLTEIENDAGEEYGLHALRNHLLENHHLNMDELNKSVISTIENYKQNQPFVDDLALFSIQLF